MHSFESMGLSDYVYYPIEYTTNAFSTVVTFSKYSEATMTNLMTWVLLVDKTKFLDGFGSDSIGGPHDEARFTVLSVGF